MNQPIKDMSKFHQILQQANKVLVLSGAGISAESGIPTFRGSGGFWRTYRSQELATPGAFKKSPSLVWEFYHYRREVVLTKQPNKAHVAIAAAEKKLAESGKKLTVVTQNVDGLHKRAGSTNVIELHGNLFKTRCTKCSQITDNTDSPITPAFKNRGLANWGSDLKLLSSMNSASSKNTCLLLNQTLLRHYSTSNAPPASNGEKHGTEPSQNPKTLSLKDKMKMAVRDYGSTVIVFHITHSLTLLGIIYIAISSGLDVKWLLLKIGLGESNVAAGASTFVVAYAVNKVLAPLRISITLGGTPFIVRYLRKLGFLKPPSSS
nr:NAD-dependent protein deacylase-like isoform X1 [Halyomorpha halys]